MKTTVVTGFSPHGHNLYGWQFLETFWKFWPGSIDLLVYTEEPIELQRGENRLIWDIPGCKEFIDKYRDDPAANGHNSPLIKKHYDYRFAAWKFCRQAFIPYHAAQGRDGLLVWLDGDVETLAPVREKFFVEVMAETDVAYLGRKQGGYSSEVGFMGFRVPEALPLLKKFSEAYATELVFTLKEWHSGFVFDWARLSFPDLRQKDLTPKKVKDERHVWPNTVLAQITEHHMGKNRKKHLGEIRNVPPSDLHH